FMCGDGQIKPADVVRVYRKLTEERLDLCKVRRVYREDGLQRKVISFFYNAIFGILFKAHTDDINGTPKIFTRRIYEAFKPVSKDWFIDAEIILKCAQLRANVGSVPVTFYRRKCGSTNVGIATIMEFLKNITLYYFMPEKFRREHGDVTKRL
ncbi:MAG: glycosyltransferase family 2 protein, partial [Candidatus Omnitrophota bacterium]